LVQTLAHIPPAFAIEDLSDTQANSKLPNTPHSISEIVAHMEFWQLWFLLRIEGVARPMVASAAAGWPEPGDWIGLRVRFLADTRRAAELGSAASRRIDPSIDFPPLSDYLVADALAHVAIHNSHHLGQIITLRQVAGLWPPAAGSWTF